MTVIRIDMLKILTLLTAFALVPLSCTTAIQPGTDTDTGQPPVTEPVPEEPDPEPEKEATGSLVPENVTLVARVTGRSESGETIPNPNRTDTRFGIGRTDYGNMWDAGDGRLLCVFGDNFDHYGGNWKSNAIAVSTDTDLSDGLYYSDMIMDGGQVKEIIVSRAKTGQYPDGSMYEVTCIPTAGVSFGGRQYLSYMSIHDWTPTGDNDYWSVNYSELVYSDDGGLTWTRSGVKWDAESNFAQAAFHKKDDTVYMYGTRSGRYGNVYLAKVPGDKMLDKTSYSYWAGGDWSPDETEAVPVAQGTVSEMTVSYNSLYDRYIMMYLSVNQRAIVYRDSPSPEGDWSGEKIIMYEDGNALYGPYIHPWFTDGKDLWFVLSHAVPTWNIFLMHADLEWDDNGVNIVSEGGFEEYTSNAIQYKTMWKVDASAMTSRTAHSGKVSCSFSNTGDGVWKDACTQTVTLRKNTDYTVECWIRPEKDIPEGAYVGVRLPDGTIHDVTEALPGDEWSKISRTFNSGDNSRADVFFGVWGGPEMKMLIDDICLKPVDN